KTKLSSISTHLIILGRYCRIWNMRQLKYLQQLESFHHVPFFTTEEAVKRDIPRHALAYLVKRGDLERIYPGTYRFLEYEPEVEFQWENLALVASSIPNGVICLISALVYYDLTDQVMREIWIAIPHKSYPPKRPNTKIVRMRNMNLGRIDISLGEYHVQIFDRERCIVDAFRYLSKEIAIKSIQRYFKNKTYKADPKKIGAYAKTLRVNITPYILSYTT
ncbi:type IV toxin-antitoxin system AbiEi family antitoxin domain-containing protein, partial [Chlamydiales bacterium]|nr:type IV toxin-antitoxin system AbiEi family antitoxin domain-containing protein [Chlamydiales bacterium]